MKGMDGVAPLWKRNMGLFDVNFSELCFVFFGLLFVHSIARVHTIGTNTSRGYEENRIDGEVRGDRGV